VNATTLWVGEELGVCFPFFKPHRDKDGYSDVLVLHNINTGLMVLRHDVGVDALFESDREMSSENEHQWIYFLFIGLFVITSIVMAAVWYQHRMFKKEKKDLNGTQQTAKEHQVAATSSVADVNEALR